MRWFLSNGRSFPWRETDDPYAVLVAEVLLHRTPASKVKPVFEALLASCPDPHSLSLTEENDLRKIIEPLGFLFRASVLRQIGRAIVERFGGRVPANLSDLKTLPGVGEYTARAVLCFAYHAPYAVVDRNIVRIYGRIFSLPVDIRNPKPTRELWELAETAMDRGRPREFNLGLLDLAALICKFSKPTCELCPLLDICDRARVRDV